MMTRSWFASAAHAELLLLLRAERAQVLLGVADGALQHVAVLADRVALARHVVTTSLRSELEARRSAEGLPLSMPIMTMSSMLMLMTIVVTSSTAELAELVPATRCCQKDVVDLVRVRVEHEVVPVGRRALVLQVGQLRLVLEVRIVEVQVVVTVIVALHQVQLVIVEIVAARHAGQTPTTVCTRRTAGRVVGAGHAAGVEER